MMMVQSISNFLLVELLKSILAHYFIVEDLADSLQLYKSFIFEANKRMYIQHYKHEIL